MGLKFVKQFYIAKNPGNTDQSTLAIEKETSKAKRITQNCMNGAKYYNHRHVFE